MQALINRIRPWSKTIYVLILLIFVFSLIYFVNLVARPKTTMVQINDLKIEAEVADTVLERKQGLSNKESSDKGKGMLFEFDETGKHSIWMKDMNFPIDIIWIMDNKIVDIVKNAPFPDENEEPESFTPKEDCSKVLEINAGLVEEFNVKIGDEIIIKSQEH